MQRAGLVVVLVGLVIAALGTAQFVAVLYLSSDPTPNPAVNGALMWLSWAVGFLVVVVGAIIAVVGRARAR